MLASLAWYLGTLFPLVGGPVFGILLGIFLSGWLRPIKELQAGLQFSGKLILQTAVVLLGFSLNLNQVFQVGALSLPVILSTIATALLVTVLLKKWLKMDQKLATLIGVGSSICGGSAIAATAPVIDADEEAIAQAISVVFLFNVLAALLFPTLGQYLGLSSHGFAIFAGTAVNDTSSVTATASIWDSLHGTHILAEATIVKLTRTLAIIPITLVLSIDSHRKQGGKEKKKAWYRAIPSFIIFFLLASLFISLWSWFGLPVTWSSQVKVVSQFLIVMAMTAIGCQTSVKSLLGSGKTAILLGGACWLAISGMSLFVQKLLGIW
ncbi:putative membrane protein YeiH [Streptococcus sp. DD12]|nr:putative membrane protein YeiH [Streptococcus sp. DD12]